MQKPLLGMFKYKIPSILSGKYLGIDSVGGLPCANLMTLHIEGHFLTCFIALVHLRLLQLDRLENEPRTDYLSALNSVKATRLKDDYYRLQESLDMQELNKLLGFDWTNGIVKFESLKKYGKGPYTT